MKIIPLIISLCIFFFFIHNVTATETNKNTETNTTQNEHDSITQITEIAGKNIADSQAKNWNNDAKLIRIGISKAELVEIEGKSKYCTTEWSYIYRFGDKYLEVLINLSEYQRGTARTEELNNEYAEKIGLNAIKPLANNWEVVSWNALNIASNSYKMSYERGDVVSGMYFEAAEINDVIIPVWNISIKNGITGIDTTYTINANTGGILIPPNPQVEISPEPSKNEPEKIGEWEVLLESIDLILGILASLAAIGAAFWAIWKHFKKRGNTS